MRNTLYCQNCIVMNNVSSFCQSFVCYSCEYINVVGNELGIMSELEYSMTIDSLSTQGLIEEGSFI